MAPDPKDFDTDYWVRHGRDIEREAVARENFQAAAMWLAAQLHPTLWNWGDGMGGWCFAEVERIFAEAGYVVPERPPAPRSTRKPISQGLRTQVFERDEYACVVCGVRRDLAVDHVIPVSKGGTNDIDNLQTMCRSHNSAKRDRLPEVAVNAD